MSADIDLSAEAVAFEAVIGRFRRMAGLGPTDKAVADVLGVGRSAYSARKAKGSLPHAEIIAYAEAHRLDLHAIFFGAPASAAPAPAAPTPPGAISIADAAALVAEVVRLSRERQA